MPNTQRFCLKLDYFQIKCQFDSIPIVGNAYLFHKPTYLFLFLAVRVFEDEEATDEQLSDSDSKELDDEDDDELEVESKQDLVES